MRPPANSFFPVTLRCLALGAAISIGASAGTNLRAAPNELGHPVFRDFPPGRSHMAHLCQAVTQDTAGFVYVANGANLVFYDGSTWRPIKVPTECAGARKFATTTDGTIFLGGASVIGWIRSAGESKEFVSLADRLPPAERNFENIYDVLAVGNTVCFSTEEKIFVWRGGNFTVVHCPTPPHSHGARLHRVGDTVYVTALDHGLCRLVNDRLEAVADDPVLRENEIISIEAGLEGALVLLTAKRGFFQLEGGRITPRPTEANRWLAGKHIICAQRVTDGSLAVAFASVSGDGGMRFDAAGHYVGPLDQFIGLYVKTIRAFFQDREGGLWLGTETGLIRLEWPSALTVFDAVNGLGQGMVADIARHEGALYAATTEGVYRLTATNPAGQIAHFERVLSQPAYSLVSHPGGLLALGYTDLFVQSPAGFTAVAKLPLGGGNMERSQRDSDRVWIATARGIQSVLHTPQGWRDEGLLRGFAENSHTVTEVADGSLWVLSPNRERFHLVFGSGAATRHHLQRVERLGVGTSSDALAECLSVDGRGSSEPAAQWRAFPAGIERVPGDGNLPQRLPQLVSATAGAVASLHEENGPEGRMLWVGGARGLVRVEVARAFPPPVPFATQLDATGVREGDHLAPRHATLKFDYVALRHQLADSVAYQTRLTGSGENWSAWSPERTRTFTSLPAGDYRFEVRARDADGQLSAPAALGFSVLPPWWLTGWAFLSYAAASYWVFTALVWIRTRSLHQRAERLEAVIAERTAELARQNTELIRLNQLELDEKTSARLAEEKARLEVLRYQLNPHFLYNTLASISASLPAGRSPARTMVERLADFCRLTLHRADKGDWTTLGEEMQLVRAYLEIEQSRWGDLLDVEITSEPALAEEQLPHFLLLPLVENALKYGRATSPDRVGLRLTARRGNDGALVIEIANTGVWIEPAEAKPVSSLGIGLDNVRERLIRHYPLSHRFEVSHADGWVTVTLQILPHPAA